jgi:hypothetical protein
VPSTTAVPEKCGAGFCTRALGVYNGNDMAVTSSVLYDKNRESAARIEVVVFAGAVVGRELRDATNLYSPTAQHRQSPAQYPRSSK